MSAQQVTDVLGEPWRAETIGLPPDDEGPVVATLVSRRADRPNGAAVLHIHGYADYFFQTEYAGWWLDRGFDFYALDLRKYGRSIRPHQTPAYVTDLHDYFAEIDLAWDRLTRRDGHSEVIASAHSTGGLTFALWAHHRQPPELVGMVLNSPWLDLHGKEWTRSKAAGAALARMARTHPTRVIPREHNGLYAMSLHRDHLGEWEFDLAWRPLESFPVRVGWLNAVRRGQAELHQRLDVTAPVLVLSSGGTHRPLEPCDELHSHDVVLDVPQIRQWATAIGSHVTYVAVPGARHDVVLSLPEPRQRVYDELRRWLRAYVHQPSPTLL